MSQRDAASRDVRVARLDAALPQTQCTRCGYPDCHAYAVAIADGEADINQCPPGGAEGVARLAALLDRAPVPLDPARGVEAPRRVARIIESGCIGCTLCIQACPVDAIAGGPKRMHTVVASWCTGCELCVAPCPTDCIVMDALPDAALRGATGWAAWSPDQAAAARRRHDARTARAARVEDERNQRLLAKALERRAQLDVAPDTDAVEQARKDAVIAAALERARRRQAGRSA